MTKAPTETVHDAGQGLGSLPRFMIIRNSILEIVRDHGPITRGEFEQAVEGWIDLDEAWSTLDELVEDKLVEHLLAVPDGADIWRVQ